MLGSLRAITFCRTAVCFVQKNRRPPLHFAVEYLQLETARFILGNALEGEESCRKLLDATQRAKLEVLRYHRSLDLLSCTLECCKVLCFSLPRCDGIQSDTSMRCFGGDGGFERVE